MLPIYALLYRLWGIVVADNNSNYVVITPVVSFANSFLCIGADCQSADKYTNYTPILLTNIITASQNGSVKFVFDSPTASSGNGDAMYYFVICK